MSTLIDQKDEILKKAKERQILEKKSYKCVERLVLHSIYTEESLSKLLQLISQDQYMDVEEERAISLLCGYPMCNHKLTKIPKQKYHISLKSSMVYDITERKNFCSNHCYEASIHLRSQISDTAVWARTQKDMRNFDFLSGKKVSSKVGEPVFLSLHKEVLEITKQLSESDINILSVKNDINDNQNVNHSKSNKIGIVDEDFNTFVKKNKLEMNINDGTVIKEFGEGLEIYEKNIDENFYITSQKYIIDKNKDISFNNRNNELKPNKCNYKLNLNNSNNIKNNCNESLEKISSNSDKKSPDKIIPFTCLGQQKGILEKKDISLPDFNSILKFMNVLRKKNEGKFGNCIKEVNYHNSCDEVNSMNSISLVDKLKNECNIILNTSKNDSDDDVVDNDDKEITEKEMYYYIEEKNSDVWLNNKADNITNKIVPDNLPCKMVPDNLTCKMVSNNEEYKTDNICSQDIILNSSNKMAEKSLISSSTFRLNKTDSCNEIDQKLDNFANEITDVNTYDVASSKIKDEIDLKNLIKCVRLIKPLPHKNKLVFPADYVCKIEEIKFNNLKINDVSEENNPDRVCEILQEIRKYRGREITSVPLNQNDEITSLSLNQIDEITSLSLKQIDEVTSLLLNQIDKISDKRNDNKEKIQNQQERKNDSGSSIEKKEDKISKISAIFESIRLKMTEWPTAETKKLFFSKSNKNFTGRSQFNEINNKKSIEAFGDELIINTKNIESGNEEVILNNNNNSNINNNNKIITLKDNKKDILDGNKETKSDDIKKVRFNINNKTITPKDNKINILNCNEEVIINDNEKVGINDHEYKKTFITNKFQNIDREKKLLKMNEIDSTYNDINIKSFLNNKKFILTNYDNVNSKDDISIDTKRKSSEMEIYSKKVEIFFHTPAPQMDQNKNGFQNCNDNNDNHENNDKNFRCGDVIIPRVDNWEQEAIRKRIVMDKLIVVFAQFTESVRLPMNSLMSFVSSLLHTFMFTNKNIVFKPLEWKIVGLIILEIINLKVESIEFRIELTDIDNIYLKQQSTLLTFFKRHIRTFANVFSNHIFSH